MKRTEIKYEEHDRFIKITGIENVADKNDVEYKFGPKIAITYFCDGAPYYMAARNSSGSREGVHMSDGIVYFTVFPGDRVLKETFTKIISILKAAGNRLIEIAKANQPEEKTILI